MEPTSVNATESGRRAKVLGTVKALLIFPVVVAAIDAVAFNVVNRNNGTLMSSGEMREYLLHVPSTYDRSKPTPLVISLHGGGVWPTHQKDTSRWNQVADARGFIVVYPAGKGPLVRHRAWRAEGDAGTDKDVRFIADLIDSLEGTYNIDPDRIYVNGLSNGGGMSFALSCTLADRIAAIGLVGTAVFAEWSWCPDRRPVPLISFHGTADRQARYRGGTSWVAGDLVFPDIEKWTAEWAHRNKCGPVPRESMVATDVRLREYTNCAPNAPVLFYTVIDGGHTWPGGGPLPEWFAGTTTKSIDASSLMWAFFREHPLSSRPR